MKKKIIFLLAPIALGLIVALSFIKVDSTNVIQAEQEQTEKEEEKSTELNPFGNTVQKENIRDGQVLRYIHGMSHQKVQAEDKWGFYLITDERVNWLLDAVKHNEPYLKHSEEYIDILTRWSNGDFSQVDKDHNFIWKLQGGTKESEKATGILSEEEEKEYINNTEDLQETNKDVEIYG